MRLFIAVDLTDRAKDLIFNKVNILKDKINDNTNWVKKENLHLTVKFLGETNKNRLDDIINQLKEIDFNLPDNYIQFKKLGAFPQLSNFRVLYVNIYKGKISINTIFNLVENSMIEIGFKSEKRKFIPHLTLARKKDDHRIEEFKDNNSKFLEDNYINVFSYLEKITLYESILKNTGPEYRKIFTKKLQ